MQFNQLFKSSPHSSFLLVFDLIGLLVCFNLAHYLRVDKLVTSPFLFGLICGITLICLYIFNAYKSETPNRALRVISRSSIACLVALLLAVLLSFLIGRDAFVPVFGRTILFAGFLFFILWSSLTRYTITRFAQLKTERNWLFIGEQSLAEKFKQEFYSHKHSGNLKLAFTDKVDTQAITEQITQPWDGIVIESLAALPADITNQLLSQRLAGQRIFSITEFYSKQWTKVPIMHIGQQWLFDVDGFSLLDDSVNYKLKRIFDFCLAIILGILCLPIMLVLALLVKIDSPGSALYIQERVGLKGKTFRLAKFRTMIADAELKGPQWSTQDDPRITKLGRFLRRTRLDELPQIYNVLLGQMSFIGPRPERPEFVIELEKEIPYYDLRHLIKPGITGWAQVMYEYGASVEQAIIKLEYDLFYVKNQSILLDSIILLKTLRIILNAKGR